MRIQVGRLVAQEAKSCPAIIRASADIKIFDNDNSVRNRSFCIYLNSRTNFIPLKLSPKDSQRSQFTVVPSRKQHLCEPKLLPLAQLWQINRTAFKLYQKSTRS